MKLVDKKLENGIDIHHTLDYLVLLSLKKAWHEEDTILYSSHDDQ